MALLFGAATSDRVDCGSGASLDNLNPFTWLAWVYPTTLTAGRTISAKNSTGTTNPKRFVLNGTGGNIEMIVVGTTDWDYITNDTPLSTLNAWKFLAVSFDAAAAAGQQINIYSGNLTTAIVENTYGTATDGATPIDEAAGAFMAGNRQTTPVSAFQGRIGHVSVYSVALTSAQIEAQRLRQFVGTNCQGFWQLGFDGVGTQLDKTANANNGTVTGATAAAHHPYIIPAASVVLSHEGMVRTGSGVGRVC